MGDCFSIWVILVISLVINITLGIINCDLAAQYNAYDFIPVKNPIQESGDIETGERKHL